MEVVTRVLTGLVLKLGDLLVGEYNLQKGVKGEIMFLHPELQSMQGALKEISRSPSDQLDHQDKIWASEVRELSYDIEDSIDTFMVRCESSHLAAPDGLRRFIDRSLDLLTRFRVRRQIAMDVRDIKRRVIEVHERREVYKIDGVLANKPAAVDPRLLGHYTKVTELVGIDEARDELIKILLEGDEASKQHGKIVSIVGFGGLGKTTLAKVVYEKIRSQFDCCAFITMFQTPDMKKLLKGLLHELGKSINEETLDLGQLIDELRKFLQQKRYFIIVDDIWDISVWKIIRCALPENNDGYNVLTTTRNFSVAEQVGVAYKLRPLSLDESRKLLYSRIFSSENKEKCLDKELFNVTNKILKKCAGVPLAITTMAGSLASKGRNVMEWYKVHNSIGTGLENSLDVVNMRKILSFSYYDLPSHLRTCLLYLSVFPEDYKISKDRLIWLWIAEGFIQCEKPEESLFELGESYFNELVNRSLIQLTNDMFYTMIQHCHLHDMVLDLICSLSSEQKFVTVSNKVCSKSPSGIVRRLSLQYLDRDSLQVAMGIQLQRVRSVVCFFRNGTFLMPDLPSFRVLRVLDLENCFLVGYDPKYLGHLFHLRYLALRNTRIAQLPEALGNLQFLQTLDLRQNHISCLPSTVFRLRHLMCLQIDVNTSVPNGIGNLTSIEELSMLGVNDDSAQTIGELGHLTEMRKLYIYSKIECNYTLVKSLFESLRKLKKIQSLCVLMLSAVWDMDVVLDCPQHLRRLELPYCWFSRLPNWMNPSLLLNLSILFICVKGLQQDDIDMIGTLPALRNLRLVGDHKIRRITRRFVVGAVLFPCLVNCDLRGFVGPVVFQQGAMLRLTTLHSQFSVQEAIEIAGGDVGPDFLGLRNLLSLQSVEICLDSKGSTKEQKKEVEAALRYAAEIHPNHPRLCVSGENNGIDHDLDIDIDLLKMMLTNRVQLGDRKPGGYRSAYTSSSSRESSQIGGDEYNYNYINPTTFAKASLR